MIAYKATRPNGTDFRTGTVDYAGALASGEVLRHPTQHKVRDEPSTYFSTSREPVGTLVGGAWPCRLFRVETAGRTMTNLSAHPLKVATSALRVVEELPAHLALGPQGEHVVALLARVRNLTQPEAEAVGAARGATWDAARYAAWALVTRDLIRDGSRWNLAAYDALTRPWRTVIGPIHPDDPDLR